MLAVFCCLLWATPFAFVKITLEYQPPLTVAGLRFLLAGLIQMILGGAVLMLCALLFEGAPALNQPPRFYGSLLWLSFVSAVAFGIWFHLLSRVKVSTLNIWKFLIPPVGALLSWLIIPGEHPDLPTLGGMALIVTGIIHSQRSPADA